MPAELLRLALRAVADLPDWSAPGTGEEAPDLLLYRLGLFGEGCPGRDPSWSWPAPGWPPFEDSAYEGLAAWLVDTVAPWGWDAAPVVTTARRVYEAANRPLPPAPLPAVYETQKLAADAMNHLFGFEPECGFDYWHATGRRKVAFDWWLDGAGRRFVLRTPADGLRPTAAGGWDR